MDITKKQIVKYVLLPEIIPRVKELALNFHWFAYLMAIIFTATRILPSNHPYVSRSYTEKFGIADVLFEARKYIKGGFRHIDQYLVYTSFVIGLALLIGQFAILVFVILTHAAEASPIVTQPFSGMFITRDPQDDLALMMLDKVFEIPNMLGSKFSPGSINEISIFGSALHRIFFFYNQGILLIAGLIVLYYMFAVVIETLQTGTPFGQRFQEVFVPFRIILALLLLVPLGYGFSSGQMMVLKLAQWGSAFATNSWILFNQRAALNPLGSTSMQLVVSPKTQEIESLLRYYSLIHSCRAIYKQQYGKEILPYVVYKNGTETVSTSATGLNFTTALGYFKGGKIKITYGQKKDSYESFPGHVKPYCGTITIPTADSDNYSASLLQATYWSFLQQLWTDTNLNAYGNRMARNFTKKTDLPVDSVTVEGWTDPDKPPEIGFYSNVRIDLQSRFASQMEQAKSQIRNSDESKMAMTADILRRGWGGAGIWFNKIAEYNGAIVSANSSVPTPGSYPAAMQQLLSGKTTTDQGLSNLTKFITTFGDGSTLRDIMSGGGLDDPNIDGQIATFLGNVYNEMSEQGVYEDGTKQHDNNPVANVFNLIFGTEGLFELRGNQEIHPLAKMSALGRSILDRAMLYMGGTLIMGGLSGLSSVIDNMTGVHPEKGLRSAFAGLGSMFSSFALVGITIGVVLYYVIPFLPFLYFFFGVGRWVKSVFEAIVGIPLWALAHLRIDGEGIAGPAAAQGYFLLLEIFLRPILVVFGLMAAVSTFSALAISLDTIFDLVITNVAGYTPIDEQGAYTLPGIEFRRSDVDQFFYTLVYALLLYMMATSCFKLIDLIPNSVLRFIGNAVAEFNDQMNLEQDTIRYTGLATYSMADDAAKATQEFGSIVGQTVVLPGNIAIDMKQLQDQDTQLQEQQRQQQEQERQRQEQERQQQEQERQQQEQARKAKDAEQSAPEEETPQPDSEPETPDEMPSTEAPEDGGKPEEAADPSKPPPEPPKPEGGKP